MNRFRYLPIGLALILLAGCSTTLRTSDSFQQERTAIDRVAVMPPQISYTKRTATVYEPDPDTELIVNTVMLEALSNALAGTRVSVAPLLLTDSLLASDQDLALGLTRARESFGDAADELARTKAKVLTVSVDPEVGQFADRADTDYLLFVRGMSYGSSGGAAAKDVAVAAATMLLFGGMAYRQQKGIQIELALVNANTAEVVWYNRNKPSETNYNPLDVASVQKLCAKLLKPLMPNS